MRSPILPLAIALIASPTALGATPQTDTVGGQGNGSFGSGSLKMATFDVAETVELQEIEFFLEVGDGATEVHFVAYRDPGGFGGLELVYDSGAVAVPGGVDFKSSGPVNGVVLERGQVYAVGVFLPDNNDVGYFFENGGGQDLGWAVNTGAEFTQNGFLGTTPPDPAPTQGSGSPYYMRITVGIGDDNDADGVGEFDDCDDGNAATFPGAEEACDGVDNNCNGEVDENVSYYDVFPDTDGDGFGDPDGEPMSICEVVAPAGYSSFATDCDDTNPAVNPDAEEVCDGVDNDCDGVELPDERTDADLDGVPVCSDCNDDDPDVFPGRTDDPCNGKDNDCDGEIPESDAQCDPLQDGEKLVPACACDSQGGGGLAWLVLPGLALLRRRD